MAPRSAPPFGNGSSGGVSGDLTDVRPVEAEREDEEPPPIVPREEEMVLEFAEDDDEEEEGALPHSVFSSSSAAFDLGENISLDEIDVGFSGKTQLAVRVKFKREGDGILLDAICCAETGAIGKKWHGKYRGG